MKTKIKLFLLLILLALGACEKPKLDGYWIDSDFYSNLDSVNIFDAPLPPSPPPIRLYYKEDNKIMIKVEELRLKYNENTLKYNDLKETVKKELIKSDYKTAFYYIVNKELKYKNYIGFIDNLISAYSELRNEYSLSEFNLPFDDLDEDTRSLVKKTIPWSFIEVDSTMLSIINSQGNAVME